MTKTIFEVSVRYFNKDSDRFKENHRIYGENNAIQYGMEFGICDNVEAVDVADAFTGEIILAMEKGLVTFLADE